MVLKIRSAIVRSRLQKGGILFDIRDVEELRRGLGLLSDRLHSFGAPDAEPVMQPMVVTAGYQLAIGARKSKNFGTVILFGLGGEYLRAERDVTVTITRWLKIARNTGTGPSSRTSNHRLPNGKVSQQQKKLN